MSRKISFALLFIFLIACTGDAEKIEMSRGQKAEQNKDYSGAVVHYQRIIDKDPKSAMGLQAALKAAELCQYELKKFTEAINFYRNIVLYSSDSSKRIAAQKKMAEIYFTQLLDYDQAIAEYQKLLTLSLPPNEEAEDRFAVAKSYFYTNNFFQALVEIDTLVKRNKNPQVAFDALNLKANIQLTSKDLDGAIATLKNLKERDPQKSKADFTDLELAMCYEEKKDFANAIQTLQGMRAYYPRKEFLDRRIRSLKERQSYLPGAKGLKK